LCFFPSLECSTPAPDTYWLEDRGPIDIEFSEDQSRLIISLPTCSFFGGLLRIVAWCSMFYAYHDYYLAVGMFVGKDQTLINALLLFPSRLIGMWLDDPLARAHADLP
ncbi:hypothetical protein FB451DRAFT_958551, partial [Mycena latifolia]